MHQIKDVEWTPRFNQLRLQCSECGCVWTHRADRWVTICTACGSRDNLENVRKNYTGALTPAEK
jgi:hypothetical protein